MVEDNAGFVISTIHLRCAQLMDRYAGSAMGKTTSEECASKEQWYT